MKGNKKTIFVIDVKKAFDWYCYILLLENLLTCENNKY